MPEGKNGYVQLTRLDLTGVRRLARVDWTEDYVGYLLLLIEAENESFRNCGGVRDACRSRCFREKIRTIAYQKHF